MKIIKATIKNEKQISELYNKFHPKRNQKNLMPIKNFKAKNIILIAEDKRKIIGFVSASLIDYAFYRYGYIEELFVEENSRGKGAGAYLIRSIVREMKRMGANTLFVTTEKSNKGAIGLYKKSGFLDDKKNKWFFQNL
jgi:ribosomal protein S18 acetylase RimI-like enzyme